MDIYHAGQTLGRLIGECTSMENLPHDISLVSVLRGASILPLDSLVSHPKFIRISPSISDLVYACEHSQQLYNRIVYCPDPCLVLPYFVDPTVLIVSNVLNAKLNDFRKFITGILGHSYFEVHPYSPRGCFKTRFADISTAVSFWRSLKYFCYNGGFINCCPVFSPSPFPEKGKIVPIPKRKKRAGRVEKKKKMKDRQIQNQISAKKLEEEMPAALPMAIMLSGKSQMPQAVLIESQKQSKFP
ncbi:hypothetical protein TRFO_06619 [Tritrichomonas foetus]|uniref:Uncharacterized protein n=1 Tax=Tritrichomonas foetus TaxID=1144522 RepID=A0A1J4JW95_9EUKA|nr:hypothetical protein TRFO_06619 [Tritrichomonas foetus]|eukprot:OHT03407.1 hypothetical protein TRFO_06619 [Tritrichomonas foetus]